MVTDTIYELLNTLAERYIPEGNHKYLHVNSREAWLDVIVKLIDRGYIQVKVSTLASLAESWERVLVQRLSVLN